MLIVEDLHYIHPNKDLLFNHLHLAVNPHQKVALIGNNGVGKSSLLKIMAGVLSPSAGTVHSDTRPYYIPQHFGQFNDYSIAKALQVEDKLMALREILEGNGTEAHLTTLDDDWTLEERCRQALAFWKLESLELTRTMESLSGGQKTKVFLAGIFIHQPEIILMDEPSNHLDLEGRHILCDFVQNTSSALVLVSHDRKLLNLVASVYEMSKQGISVYGGNYDFYAEQKSIESKSLQQDILSKEKALRKAKEIERESMERQQKLDARGKKKQEKAGLPTIAMKTLKNNAEKSTARIKDIHAEKTGNINQALNQLRRALPDADKMKFGFDHSLLHKGKVLVDAKGINFGYGQQMLWQQDLDLKIASGDRMAIKGLNGSGKTTLIKIILGEIAPQKGTIQRAAVKAIYIDQEYSLIDKQLSVFGQSQRFNSSALQEHEIKIRLNRFLFTKDHWDKPCHTLSGGEKMRLMLCCLTISQQAPDIIVLDEPTNNLDLQNVEILTTAINDYHGTLMVISHDELFLEEINVRQSIDLK